MNTIFFEKFKKDYQGKKVLIMGLGLLGRGVQDAAFFAALGAKVTVTDLKTSGQLASSIAALGKYKIRYVLGKHEQQDFLNSDVIIRNADVNLNSPFLELARHNHIPIEMDEALFMKYAPIRLIGITGTRGKSTTTTLIYEILKKAGLPVWLAGNISGTATLPLLNKIKANDWVVAELSSWQLQGFKEIKKSPYIAVVTNLYEDHLNRYPSLKDYFQDKKIIYKFQTKKDFLILNNQIPLLYEWAKEAKSQVKWFNQKDIPVDWKLQLKGEHNLSNCAATLSVAKLLNIPLTIIKKTITEFEGLPYRLEKVAEIKGITYINDSTSTTPKAGIAALKSFSKPIILIAGGFSKKLNMTAFCKLASEKVKKVVLLQGAETNNIIQLLNKFGGKTKIAGTFDSLEKAVLAACKFAENGDIILFSPACASFGMFINEFDRGNQFNKIIRSIRND